jgi:hypothetical protein
MTSSLYQSGFNVFGIEFAIVSPFQEFFAFCGWQWVHCCRSLFYSSKSIFSKVGLRLNRPMG